MPNIKEISFTTVRNVINYQNFGGNKTLQTVYFHLVSYVLGNNDGDFKIIQNSDYDPKTQNTENYFTTNFAGYTIIHKY